MNMILLKLLLCLSVTYTPIRNVRAGTADLLVGTNNDVNSPTEQVGTAHSHENSSDLEVTQDGDIPYDLGITTNKGLLVKYQTVVRIFCKAVNAVLLRERKTPPDQIHEILQNLENLELPQKDTLDLEDMGNLYKIFSFANEALYHYEDVLLGIKRPYVKRARYFRLLTWLKFQIRSKPDTPNELVEPKIDEILKPRDDDTQLKNLESLLSDTMEMFREEYLRITTLGELMYHGCGDDEIFALFYQLAENDGNIDKVEQQVLEIIPLFGEESINSDNCEQIQVPKNVEKGVDHDDCEEIRQTIEIIASGFSEKFPDKFRAEFKKKPEELLLYVNEAFRIRCKIEYKRADAQKIKLEHNIIRINDDVFLVEYLRDVMILYNNAIEKKLRPTMDENAMDTILRLENFPVKADYAEQLQMDTLLYLSNIVVSNYQMQIRNYYNGQAKLLDDTLEACYTRLTIWIHKQVSSIHLPDQNPIPKQVLLGNIWNNLNVGHQSVTNLDDLINQPYGAISTLNALIDLCEGGTFPLLQ